MIHFSFANAYLDSEEAVESGTLDEFLRLKEEWRDDEERPQLPQKAIGVPGAVAPLQMTPDHLKKKILARPPESPLKEKSKPVNKEQGTFDISTELQGYGLQGVHVTEDELAKLVAELGLNGEEAGTLVQELAGSSQKKRTSRNEQTKQVVTENSNPLKESEVKQEGVSKISEKIKSPEKEETAGKRINSEESNVSVS
jgi:SH3 domain-binding glutamic acid-rich protein